MNVTGRRGSAPAPLRIRASLIQKRWAKPGAAPKARPPALRRRAQRGANPQPLGISAAQWPAYPGMGCRIGLLVWVILGLGGDLNDEDDN